MRIHVAVAALASTAVGAFALESRTSSRLARTNALLREARSAEARGETEVCIGRLTTVLRENEQSRLAPLLALAIGDLYARDGDERAAEAEWEHASALSAAWRDAEQTKAERGAAEIAQLLRRLPGPTVIQTRAPPATLRSGGEEALLLDSTTAMHGVPTARLARLAHNRGEVARAEALYFRALPAFCKKEHLAALRADGVRRAALRDDTREGRGDVSVALRSAPPRVVLDLAPANAHAAAALCFNLACLFAEDGRLPAALSVVARTDELALYAGTPAAQRAPIAALCAELRAMGAVELGVEPRAAKEGARVEDLELAAPTRGASQRPALDPPSSS